MPKPCLAYVVDDEPQVRDLLICLCGERGFASRGYHDGDQFLDAVEGLEPGCVLLDMRLPGRTGLEVLGELARRGLSFPVIAITGHADTGMAVEAMKMGAVDFLEKPFDTDQLFDALDRGLAMLDEAHPRGGAPRNEEGADGFNG